MGKLDREIENRMRVKQTRKKFEKFIGECERKEKTLIEKAAEAKSKGLKAEYNQTLVFLKMIVARKEKSKHMLHQLTLQELLRDEASNTKQFNESMVVLSKETAKLFGNFDYKKMLKEQQKMAIEAQKTKSKLDMFLDQADSVFDDISDMESNVEIDDELEARINAQLSEIDINIDEQLAKFNEL
ncbi:MAG: hypothetical protein E7176_06520 [Erysipelotrichaceae bacterium]|nr:hypothetical protein [Erysipelotrichaceae bacterium]